MSIVQPSPSSHATVVPARQPVPGTMEVALQVSTPLQYCPSEQVALFGVCWQPVAGVHVSTVHEIPSSQLNGEG